MVAEGDGTPGPRLTDVPFGVGPFGSGVDFSDAEERTRWLEELPVEMSMVLAARAALRVVPAFTLASGSTGTRMARRRMLLRVFRSVETAWAISAFVGEREVLRAAARSAAVGLSGVQESPPVRAAAYALAASLAPDTEIAARASTAVSYALDAAGENGRGAFVATLDAIGNDANLLSQRFSPVTIAISQLWPNPASDWAQQNWDDLKRSLLAENEDWQVWCQWYDDRVSGTVLHPRTEVARATIPDEIWQQEPKVVNRHIQEIIEEAEIFRDALAPDALVVGSGGSEPEPRPGGLQGAHATGKAGSFTTLAEEVEQPSSHATLVGRSTLVAAGEVVPNPSIEVVVSRIRSDPQVFEDVARFAARSIRKELETLSAQIPNEPRALEGYQVVRVVLEELQAGFEVLASSVHESVEETSPVERTTLLKKTAAAALSMSVGFVDWLNENGDKAGRVIAELGLAGVIAGTLSYFVGVPPLISFPVTVAALEGKSIWDAIVLFAPGGAKDTHKHD